MQRFVPGHLGAQVTHLQMLVCVFESYILSRWNRKEGEKNIPNRVGFCFEFVFSYPCFFFSLCTRYGKTQPGTLCAVEEVRHGLGVSLTR